MVIALLLAGCEPADQFSYSGYAMSAFFPFDGSARDWEYSNTDPLVDYTLVATLDTAYATIGNSKAYTISYETVCIDGASDCVGGPVRDVAYSSDGAGTGIHSYSSAADGTVSFPPVRLTPDHMSPGEDVTTDVDGVIWTSTFVAIETCPVLWTDEWDECIHLRLDDGGSGSPLAGDYWAVTSWNIVAMQLADDTGQWKLTNANWTPEE